MSEIRIAAERRYADELAALARRTTPRGPRAGGSRRGRSKPTSWGRQARRRRGDHAEVRRRPGDRPGRDRDARLRPRADARRRAGHGQELAVGAPVRGDQRRLERARRAGHGGHQRGAHQVRRGTTRCSSPRARASGRSSPSPVLRAMREGTFARLRGDHPHRSEIQDALISILSEKQIAIPELGEIVTRAARVQHHRHRQHARSRRQRDERGAQAPVQLRDRARSSTTSSRRSGS